MFSQLPTLTVELESYIQKNVMNIPLFLSPYRLGKVYIPDVIIQENYVSDYSRIFSRRSTLILDSHPLITNGLICFLLLNDKFDEIRLGDNIPEYDVTIIRDNNREEIIHVTWVRKQAFNYKIKIMEKIKRIFGKKEKN